MLYERNQLNATFAKRFQATSFESFTDKFRSPFDENRLWIGCSMKRADHCFFRRVSANIHLGEHVLKTSWRHNCKTSCKHVLITPWRCLADVLEDVLKTSWRHLEKILGRHIANTSWRRLEDILGRRIANTSWKRSWKTKSFSLKTSSSCLQDVLENKKCLLGWFKTVTFRNAYW